MKTLLLILIVFMSLIKGADTMKTVEFVDLEKFMGKWFVIALVPNMIEKGATNSSDTYVLNDDGTIDITYDAIKDGSYEYMAVGYPKNTMGWIMGRSSSVSEDDYKKIINSLIELGYTADQFELVKHD